jgi:hypothetical protein
MLLVQPGLPFTMLPTVVLIAHLLHTTPTQENPTFYDDDTMTTTQDPLFLSPDSPDFQSPG